MPGLQWEWKWGPQTIISLMMLLVMLAGVIGVYGDIRVAQSQVSDLRDAVTRLTNVQQQEAVEQADTRTKIDIMLPALQHIEELINRPSAPSDGNGDKHG